MCALLGFSDVVLQTHDDVGECLAFFAADSDSKFFSDHDVDFGRFAGGLSTSLGQLYQPHPTVVGIRESFEQSATFQPVDVGAGDGSPLS